MQRDETLIHKELEFIFPVISGKVSMAINRLMSRNFRKNGLDITPEQWTVLAFLWREDGLSQQQLCDATFKDKPSMTRLIDNLERQDYVVRKPSPTDRRSNLIYTTEKSQSIREQANNAVFDVVDWALKDVSDDDFVQMRQLMHVIFGNIQEALEK
ncbi:MarR family transcriptional regulator [Dysgonomonas sp. 25]|uniref:MarR family winged helix-turn-helix transcriptional regulator n=1 Tax=Dysgonomonas sp. 25 TaxID=2302933 RepID=UPI0013CFF84F|nr:MarR family transcriptional regulator [Dysgonomonas sp. 25]